ncbi:hypothetical protein [Flectobacillus major]|uniref:hypothetical protein n=1 Tax=Flectobacillus major TaxID=103 RepID=UPI00040ABF71|nr:hypothetical protein [Flectobacillus major]
MFELNPLLQENAWWQHLIMLLGAGFLGYIIGYRNSDKSISLDAQIQQLDEELKLCEKQRKTKVNTDATLPLNATEKAFARALLVPLGDEKDDLKLIEGIGPKIEQLLNQNDIYTFGQLSKVPVETIRELLHLAGPRFQMHDPSTWPRQAQMAANGNWQELKDWQDILNKGKE